MKTFTPGYPTDLRSDEQRVRASKTVVGDFEGSAARVIARLTGAHVIIQDDNSEPSMADIRIERPGLPEGFAEVVFDVDRGYAAVADAVRRRQIIRAPSLSRIWFVTVGPAARVHDLVKNLVGVLESLEGIGEFLAGARFDQDLAAHPDPAVQLLSRRGVVRLTSAQLGRGDEPKIQINAVGTGGTAELDWSSFDQWLGGMLASEKLEDVRRKLAATGSPERHAFLGVSFTTPWPTYHALSDRYRDLPPTHPTLPTEVTHVWVWSQLGRCIAWFPGRGWFEPRYHWATE